MPEITSLTAERRERAGKGAARATRRMGRVPGIIYGGKQEPVLISLEPRELSRAVANRGFLATLVDVKVDGAVERALPREVQRHPVTDRPLHVDFMRVSGDTRVIVTVPVVFINHELSIGLRRGGILNVVRHG
ncbi:MAG: 50S ribosomal protein L25/general stress protein Ctc, partial [Alphaproteobacteria bacterium]|nr:50S ribosomal protein L25/general stress protein Ctc [Alphaproteobacteria bacterium]